MLTTLKATTRPAGERRSWLYACSALRSHLFWVRKPCKSCFDDENVCPCLPFPNRLRAPCPPPPPLCRASHETTCLPARTNTFARSQTASGRAGTNMWCAQSNGTRGHVVPQQWLLHRTNPQSPQTITTWICSCTYVHKPHVGITSTVHCGS